MNPDGYSVAEQKVLDDAAEKYQFQVRLFKPAVIGG